MVMRTGDIGDFPALVSASLPQLGPRPIEIILRSQRELDLFLGDIHTLFPGVLCVVDILWGLDESDIAKLLGESGR